MKLIINGKDKYFDSDKIAILELLKLENVKASDMISVQLNGNFGKREEFGFVYLKENDEVDFLYFMCGGSK